MSKLLCVSVSAMLLAVMLLSGTAYAVDKNVPILYGNMTGIATVAAADGTLKQLSEVLLVPAGYTNTKLVLTVADFKAEWAKRNDYSVLIFAYHTFTNATIGAEMIAWLKAELTNIDAWVKGGGIIITTMGRDNANGEEQPWLDLFGLKISDPGTGTEAVVPIAAAFAKGIAGGICDSTGSADATPNNGQVYNEPLPSWANVVATNAAGKPISVAGRYGNGAIWAGAGFEIINMGAGIDPDQSMFKGFKQLWANMMDYLTTPPVTAVDNTGKLSSTWGSLKSE